MKVGYARVSKHDNSQVLDLQIDALLKSGVKKKDIYTDKSSGKREDRPGLESCLKALRKNDTLVIWKLDRLGRDIRHLINTVHDLADQGIGLKVISGEAVFDTKSASGKLVLNIFAAFADFERELIRERTLAGLKSARARGRVGGAKLTLTPAQVKLAQTAMKDRTTVVNDLCKQLAISPATLYRYVSPTGALREHGKKVLGKKK